MNQSLHIFRKDVRHLWPDLSLYALLLIAFSWAAPQIWIGSESDQPLLPILIGLLRAIIPIVWLVMVARLVQDESLVGDQQFWITRPYTWASLFAAKVLFAVAFILVPFAAMQCYLLAHAGLHPFGSLPALGLNLLYVAFVLVIFFAVSVVTSTFPRMATSVLGAVIVLIVATAILGNHFGVRTTPPFVPGVPFLLFAALVLAVIVYQYVTRSTTRSRIALCILPVLLGFMIFDAPSNFLFNHEYPASLEGSTPHLVYNSDPALYPSQAGKPVVFNGNAFVTLPVRLQGIDANHRIDSASLSYTVDAPGFHYASPWVRTSSGAALVAISMPQSVLDRFPQGTTAHLHFIAVGDLLQLGSPQTVTSSDRFTVPDNGLCIQPPEGGGMRTICRYAFAVPVPTRISAAVSAQPCRMAAPTRTANAQVRAGISIPAFDPVHEERVSFADGGFLCSGTTVTFTDLVPAGKFRTEVDVPATPLAPYIAHRDMQPQRRPDTQSVPAPPAGVAPAQPAPTQPMAPAKPPPPAR